jgi:hypothetical protein
MPLAAPVIDDRIYDALLGEILRRIPVESPRWADLNESDPGVTLVELLAFLTENLLWHLDEREYRRRRRRRRRRVAVLGVATAGTGFFLWAWGRRHA